MAPFTVSFAEQTIPPPVARVCGLGAAEGWGRWNTDTRISIRFSHDLPPSFEARIACAVAPANIGRVITLIAGGCCRKLVVARTLRQGVESASVRFHTAVPARALEILVPDVEPGGIGDPRALGFALASIRIAALPDEAAGHG